MLLRAITSCVCRARIPTAQNGKETRLGIFDTAKEAALAYARHIGPEESAKEFAAQAGSMTASQALDAARREGLTLATNTRRDGTPGTSHLADSTARTHPFL